MSGGDLNLSLPQTGTYRVFVDPDYGAATNAQLTLTSGQTNGLAIDGEAIDAATNLPGERIYFKVDATAGQNISAAISALSVSEGTYVNIAAYEPDGDTYQSETRCYVSEGGCDVDIFRPVTGSYMVVVRPATATQVMQFKMSLASDVTGVLPRDTATELNLSRPGQNGWLSFNGTAGESLAIQAANQQTSPVGTEARYLVFRPSDTGSTSWKSITGVLSGGVLNLSLPTTGTYMLFVDPDYGAVGSTQLTLSTGTTNGLEPDGAPVSVETGLPGKRFTFLCRRLRDKIGPSRYPTWLSAAELTWISWLTSPTEIFIPQRLVAMWLMAAAMWTSSSQSLVLIKWLSRLRQATKPCSSMRWSPPT